MVDFKPPLKRRGSLDGNHGSKEGRLVAQTPMGDWGVLRSPDGAGSEKAAARQPALAETVTLDAHVLRVPAHGAAARPA